MLAKKDSATQARHASIPDPLADVHMMREFDALTAGLIQRLAPVAVAAAMLWLAMVWAVA
jgi:type II secretory pathway component PulK